MRGCSAPSVRSSDRDARARTAIRPWRRRRAAGRCRQAGRPRAATYGSSATAHASPSIFSARSSSGRASSNLPVVLQSEAAVVAASATPAWSGRRRSPRAARRTRIAYEPGAVVPGAGLIATVYDAVPVGHHVDLLSPRARRSRPETRRSRAIRADRSARPRRCPRCSTITLTYSPAAQRERVAMLFPAESVAARSPALRRAWTCCSARSS